MTWAANMAVGLGTGVPWVMCKQDDAPDPVVKLSFSDAHWRCVTILTSSFHCRLLLFWLGCRSTHVTDSTVMNSRLTGTTSRHFGLKRGVAGLYRFVLLQCLSIHSSNYFISKTALKINQVHRVRWPHSSASCSRFGVCSRTFHPERRIHVQLLHGMYPVMLSLVVLPSIDPH